jgi:hypothetical protein
MNSQRFLRLLSTAIIFFVVPSIPVSSIAKGGGLSYSGKPNRVFRELVIQGERPEIVSCLLATLENVKHNKKYNEIIIPDDVSDMAIMHENVSNNGLIRTITFSTLAKDRASNPLQLNTWSKVMVSCEQIEEALPNVTLASLP